MDLNIDNIDIQILTLLMENAKNPYAMIGAALGVSTGTVHGRIRKLEQNGIIKRHLLVVDYSKLGFDISAFLGIYLHSSSLYKQVASKLYEIDEVVSLDYPTGMYSMFVKLICRDTRHLKDVLHEKIQKIEGIQRTETFISLDESINRPAKIT
ncbi:MAG TPA: Lrp/AsnC ligand binding domain-containing protein [Chitinophagales bacterium]|nr:Lrp/AsnC ligand binding domain-containing protein [Chitinophagales bacterium]